MADRKVTELPQQFFASGDDLLMVVNDPDGTQPTSNKISVRGFFANVAADSVFKGTSRFDKNVTIQGTTLTLTANCTLQSGGKSAIDLHNSILDRMQVANTNALVDDRMQVANTVLLVEDRMQVANAEALLVNSTLTGTTSAQAITISGGTGFNLSSGSTPSDSDPATDGYLAGTIWYDSNYLYIAVDSETIKRVALSTF